MNGCPAKNRDLRGSVPENSPIAPLFIDLINDLASEAADALVRGASDRRR